MTKQEIKDLVLAKIAGQGTQVDLGGALPSILDAIVDALPEGGASPIAPEPAITINVEGLSGATFEDSAETFGISVEELLSLPNQLVIKTVPGGVLTRTTLNEDGGIVYAEFGSQSVYFHISIDGNNNSVNSESN